VRAQALGEHRREDVGFFRIGQRRKHIGAVDVLLDQQLFVRGVAVQHDGVSSSSAMRRARRASRSMIFTWLCCSSVLARRKPMLPPAGDDDAPRRVVGVA